MKIKYNKFMTKKKMLSTKSDKKINLNIPIDGHKGPGADLPAA